MIAFRALRKRLVLVSEPNRRFHVHHSQPMRNPGLFGGCQIRFLLECVNSWVTLTNTCQEMVPILPDHCQAFLYQALKMDKVEGKDKNSSFHVQHKRRMLSCHPWWPSHQERSNQGSHVYHGQGCKLKPVSNQRVVVQTGTFYHEEQQKMTFSFVPHSLDHHV